MDLWSANFIWPALMGTVRPARVLPLVFVATLACLSAHAQFLYGLSCNSVVKLDAATGRQVGAVELSSRTKLVPRESPRTAFCDLEAMTYDAGHHTVAVEVNDRRNGVYRRLVFSLPEFQMVSASVLKRQWHEDGDEDSGASAPAVPQVPGTVREGSLRGSLGLGRYAATGDLKMCTAYGQGKVLLSEPVIEASERVVLKTSCAGGKRFFVVSRRSRQIAPLALPAEAELAGTFVTSDGHYLLAAGQRAGVKVEVKGAWLVDLASGSLVRRWTDPQLVGAVFLGFTGKGSLLFQQQGGNFVLDAGVRFEPTVARSGYFFADR